MHIGVAHHLGWAILITATSDQEVVDRRRIELIDGGLPAAPIHYRSGSDDLSAPIETLSLRDWPDDFPTDIVLVRRAPLESQADSVMYRQVIADAADERGWRLHRFDAKTIEADAIALLGDDSALERHRIRTQPCRGRDRPAPDADCQGGEVRRSPVGGFEETGGGT